MASGSIFGAQKIRSERNLLESLRKTIMTTLIIQRFISSLGSSIGLFCDVCTCRLRRCETGVEKWAKLCFCLVAAPFSLAVSSRLNKRPRSEMSPKFVHHLKLSTDSLDWTHLIRIDVGSQRLAEGNPLLPVRDNGEPCHTRKVPTLAEISRRAARISVNWIVTAR